MFGRSRTELKHGLLGNIQIVHHHVNVHLLRDVLARPLGRSVSVDELEADALVTGGVAHLAPPVIRARLPIEEDSIEVGEAAWVVAVEHDGGEASDRHDRNLRPIEDSDGPQSMAR
jgi:hypothetical protein